MASAAAIIGTARPICSNREPNERNVRSIRSLQIGSGTRCDSTRRLTTDTELAVGSAPS